MKIWELAENGDVEGVRALLDSEADINAENDRDRTSLHLAAAEGHEAVVRLLLDHAAANKICIVSKVDDWGKTPLHWAVYEEENEVIVRLLLDHGAKVNAKDCWRQTPLHCAAREGNEAIVRLLLFRGASVNVWAIERRTPLQNAAEGKHYNIVRLLLGYGVNPFLSDQPFTWKAKQERLSRAKALYPIAPECILPPEIMLKILATALQIPERRWLSFETGFSLLTSCIV